MMSKRIEFFRYPLFDHTSMERHFEEQAMRGWFLYRIGIFSWYQKGEPGHRHYAIGYFPEGRVYSPAEENEKAFEEYCEEAGWACVAQNGSLKVFCNEQESPVPLDTDPAIQVENIRLATKKTRIFNTVLFLVGILHTLYFVAQLCYDPVRVLSSNTGMMYAALFALASFATAAELLAYGRWYKQAKCNAEEQGVFTDTFHYVFIHRLFYVLLGMLLVMQGAAMGRIWFVAPLVLMIWFACTMIAEIMRTGMRKGGVPGWANLILVLCVTFVCYLGGMLFLTYGTIRHTDHASIRNINGFYVDDPSGMTPIHIRDLMNDPVQIVFAPYSSRGSLFLSQLEVEEYGEAPSAGDASPEERPPAIAADMWAAQSEDRVYHLRYQLTKVHVGFLMQLTEKGLVKREQGEKEWEEFSVQGTNARRILQTTYSHGSGPEIRYLICMEDRFLVINVQEALSDDQFKWLCEAVGRL